MTNHDHHLVALAIDDEFIIDDDRCETCGDGIDHCQCIDIWEDEI